MKLTGKPQNQKGNNNTDKAEEREKNALVFLLQRQKPYFEKDIRTIRYIIYSGFTSILFSFIAFLIVEKYLTDPYVNLLEVEIGHKVTKSELVKKKINKLDYVQSTSSFSRESFRIRRIDSDSNNYSVFFARTIGYVDSLKQTMDSIMLTSVLNRSNLRFGNKKRLLCGELEKGILVTERLLKECGYNSNSSHLYRWNESGKEFALSVPIVGVVKDLPGRTDILFTEAVWRNYFSNSIEDLILKKYPIMLFVDKSIKSRIVDAAASFAKKEPNNLNSNILNKIDYDFKDRGELYKLTLTSEPFVSSNEKVECFYKSLIKYLYSKNPESRKLIFRVFSKSDQIDKSSTNDYLAMHLKPRNYLKIMIGQNYDELQTLLQDDYLDLDASRIKRQEFIPKILLVFFFLGILFFLMTFLYLAIYLHVQIKKFLNELRKSYGQLKAVGVSGSILQYANEKVILGFLKDALFGSFHLKYKSTKAPFLFSCFCVSILVALHFGSFITFDWITFFFFFLFNSFTLTVSLIILKNSIVKEISQFVQKDPGNLIYAS